MDRPDPEVRRELRDRPDGGAQDPVAALERVAHPVERAGEPSDLVAIVGGQTDGKVPGGHRRQSSADGVEAQPETTAEEDGQDRRRHDRQEQADGEQRDEPVAHRAEPLDPHRRDVPADGRPSTPVSGIAPPAYPDRTATAGPVVGAGSGARSGANAAAAVSSLATRSLPDWSKTAPSNPVTSLASTTNDGSSRRANARPTGWPRPASTPGPVRPVRSIGWKSTW